MLEINTAVPKLCRIGWFHTLVFQQNYPIAQFGYLRVARRLRHRSQRITSASCRTSMVGFGTGRKDRTRARVRADGAAELATFSPAE